MIFRPIAKKPEARGRRSIRPIGMWRTNWQLFDHRTPLLIALEDKARRYGQLGLPYLIAINAMETIDEIDVMETLFGRERWHIPVDAPEVEPAMSREPNGLWTNDVGPKNTGVSGVLLFKRLTPWFICHFPPRLYHNPWPAHPYTGVLTQLPQAVPDRGRMQYVDGVSLRQLLGLAGA